METVLDFIKDFRLSTYGLDAQDIWIIAGVLIVSFILANVLISFLPTRTAGRLKKILTVVVFWMLYGVIIFLMLNAFLTKDYEKLAALIFVLIVPYLRRGVDLFYETYDNLVDKVTGGRRKEN